MSRSATRFGRISAPNEAWLARQPIEPILDPDLPIIDTHHHLWDRPDHRYVLADYWRPYLETCIESNFPVEKMGIGYAALWNAFKRVAAGASAEEKLALFSGTARRAYRL